MFNNISHRPTLPSPPQKTLTVTYNNNNNNNELYLHNHTSTYSIAKAIFRNQNYKTGHAIINNLSRPSKQAEIYFMNGKLIK